MKNTLFTSIKFVCTYCLLVLFSLHYTEGSAQAAINTTGNAPDSKAMLDITSNTKGLLMPRMTTVERNAISAPTTPPTTTPIGLLVYDITTSSIWQFNGLEWIEFGTATGLKYHPSRNALVFNDPTRANAQIGVNSTAFGNNSMASGFMSFVSGLNSTASGSYSTVLGTASTASGNQSMAFGNLSLASGDYSTAFDGGQALAGGAFAMGNTATATGISSIAFGAFTTAQARLSMSIGTYNDPISSSSTDAWVNTDPLFIVGNGTSQFARSNALVLRKNGNLKVSGNLSSGTSTASSTYATALGGSTASGQYASAFGRATASGDYATAAGGVNCTATGEFATALGYYSTASGQYSTALTRGQASGQYAIAIGNCVASGLYATALGNAVASGTYSTGLGASSTASGYNSTVLGSFSEARSAYCTTIGSRCDPILTTPQIYYNDWNLTDPLFIIGNGNPVTNTTSNALVAYKNGNLKVSGNIASGTSTASGNFSTAFGSNSIASGDNSVAMGYNSRALGGNSIVLGDFVTANASYCTVIGSRNDPIATTVQNSFSWTTTDPLFIIGNSADGVTPSNAFIVFKNGNATLNGILTQTSDRRLKHNITPLSNALDKVLKINGMNYFWKDTTTHDNRLQAGVIAQEVQAVMPELVNTDTKGMLSVNYQGLTPYLIESIKELKKENDELKQQIAAFNTLKTDVEALKAALQTGVPKQETPSVKNAEKTAIERK